MNVELTERSRWSSIVSGYCCYCDVVVDGVHVFAVVGDGACDVICRFCLTLITPLLYKYDLNGLKERIAEIVTYTESR